MQLRVSGAQIPVTNNVDLNFKTICKAVDYAISENADILLTPEGSLSGYNNTFDSTAAKDRLKQIIDRAAGGNLALALGTCYYEDEEGMYYNQIRFYDKNGVFKGSHNKILLGRSSLDPIMGEYDLFGIKPLAAFMLDGVKTGGLICNDIFANPLWTPYTARNLTQELSDMGVKVIFHAVHAGKGMDDFRNSVIKPYHESIMRMSAKAGKLWIVTADNSYPTDIAGSSPSGVIDPDGNWTVQVPLQGEQYYTCTIDFDKF